MGEYIMMGGDVHEQSPRLGAVRTRGASPTHGPVPVDSRQ